MIQKIKLTPFKKQKQLNDNRKNFSDEDWINAFNGKENYENAFKILTIDDAIIDKYYLKNNIRY